MTSEIYELIFRGLKAKYPRQAIGPRFQAVCAALDEWDESANTRAKITGNLAQEAAKAERNNRNRRNKCTP